MAWKSGKQRFLSPPQEDQSAGIKGGGAGLIFSSETARYEVMQLLP